MAIETLATAAVALLPWLLFELPVTPAGFLPGQVVSAGSHLPRPYRARHPRAGRHTEMGFTIQIGGREYTPEQLRNDPDAARQVFGDDTGTVHVTNIVHGEQNGIQAGTINGSIHVD